MRLLGARSRAVLLAIMVALSSAAVGLPPASATEASLHVRAVAGVQAQGAGLAVEVGLNCPEDDDLLPGLLVTATQRQDDGTVVTGRGITEVGCIGTPQVIRVAVSSVGFGMEAGTGARFRPGVAFVSARLDYCGFDCRILRAGRTVQTPALLMDHARSISPHATVNLPATATLEGDGAAVRIRILYRCLAHVEFGGGFEAKLVQRTTADAVSGNEHETILLSCTGASRSEVLIFHGGATAWKAGVAVLIVRGTTYVDEFNRQPIHAHRTLTLT